MYEYSELVLFIRLRTQTAALRGQSALELDSAEAQLEAVWM